VSTPTHNVAVSHTANAVIITLPRHRGLADALRAAGIGELSAAAHPGSGGSNVVTQYNPKAVAHYCQLLVAAAVPQDPEVAGMLASVRAQLG
jgi:hypothetical protein